MESAVVEVIDLTTEQKHIVIEDSDEEVHLISANKRSRLESHPTPDKTLTTKNDSKRLVNPDRKTDGGAVNGKIRSTTPKGPRSQKLPELPLAGSDVFFFDSNPSDVSVWGTHLSSPAPDSSARSQTDEGKNVNSLLLPPHVSIDGEDEGIVPLKTLQPPSDPRADDYIEYLDYDDQKATGITRYFHDPEGDSKQRFVCKNCGGDHKTFECTVQICLTCGARNEHSTRGCPVSKTCFRCRMKGHISANCPNRYSRNDGYEECDRCGSDIHKTEECPTLWRVYEYVSNEERERVLEQRRSKNGLDIGEGGEGYIAEDEWCYNCGQCGHWGDDCDQSHQHDRPKEPSAFGSYNLMSGPFFDPAEEPKHSSTKPRKPIDWEGDDTIPDGWGKNAPINVGRQGRRKAKESLENQLRVLRDDEDDWFGDSKKIRSNRTQDGNAPRQRGDSSSNPKKSAFTISIKSDSRSSHARESSPRNQNHSHPGLLDRLHRMNPDDVQHFDPKGRSSKSHRDDERDRRRRDGDRNFRRVDDRGSHNRMNDRDVRRMDGQDFREMDDRDFSRRGDGRARGESDRDGRSHRDRDARKWNDRGLLDRIRDPHSSKIDARQNQPGPRYKGGYHNSRP